MWQLQTVPLQFWVLNMWSFHNKLGKITAISKKLVIPDNTSNTEVGQKYISAFFLFNLDSSLITSVY